MPSKPLRRTVIAILAIIAGIVLGVFEAAGAGSTSAGELWFWSAVAALLTILGLAELFSPNQKK